MSGDFILLFLVFYPIIGALVSYLIGRKWKIARDHIAQIVAISEFLVILDLMIKYVISMQNGIAKLRSFRLAGVSLPETDCILLWTDSVHYMEPSPH